jgi:hypothetical protein
MTRAATRGDGEVIGLDLGITVYRPPAGRRPAAGGLVPLTIPQARPSWTVITPSCAGPESTRTRDLGGWQGRPSSGRPCR